MIHSHCMVGAVSKRQKKKLLKVYEQCMTVVWKQSYILKKHIKT